MAIDKTLAIIREAIKIERYGYDFYTIMRSQVDDRSGQIVLSYLAKLEADHMKWLEDEYIRQLNSLEELDEGKTEPLKLMAMEEIFVVDALPEMYKGADHVQALEFAIDVEKNSVAFYTKAMEHSDTESLKELFRKLADFERDHMEFLAHNVKRLKEQGLWDAENAENLHG